MVGDSVDNQYVEVTLAYTMYALYYTNVLTQLLIPVLRLLTVWYGYWCTARSMCCTKYMYVVCGMEAGQVCVYNALQYNMLHCSQEMGISEHNLWVDLLSN